MKLFFGSYCSCGILGAFYCYGRRGVAQLVACLVWDQEAPSSSLGTPTESGEVLMIDAVPVAQWIEHQPSKLRVTGSSPVGRTNGSP